MTIAVRNVRVFDGDRVLDPGTVVIDGGRIGETRSGAEVVDGGGGVLLPGLVDAHVHLAGADDLARLAGWGITTALDMACWPPSRVDSLRGRAPDIRSAGIPAIGPGGNHARLLGVPAEGILTAPDQAELFVAKRVAEGSDYVKVVIEGDLLDQATIDGVVRAARAHEKLSVAHASSVAAYRMAVRAGADIVTHVPRDGVVDEATVARMAEAGQVAVPTLTMMRAVIKQAGPPGDDYSYSRDSVTALHAAGVPILAGTDAISGPGPLPNPVTHGGSLHRELSLLVDAGLSPTEALRAAMSLPARHFGLGDRGAVSAGLRADLVLLDGDPTEDITTTNRITRIWCCGSEITPRTD